MKKIILDFKQFKLKAELFSTDIAGKFYNILPCPIDLTGWGHELYGTTGKDLGSENPVPLIPAGGLAYSTRGQYLCIFFGQTPAWPVEDIGRITDDWGLLNDGLRHVQVYKA